MESPVDQVLNYFFPSEPTAEAQEPPTDVEEPPATETSSLLQKEKLEDVVTEEVVPAIIVGELTQNTYSLIYVAPYSSSAFFFGIFFALFQFGMAYLAFSDLIEWEDPSNPLRVPEHVDWEVEAAGFLALTLAVPLFKDVMDSTRKLGEGWHPVNPEDGTTAFKFYLAYMMQFVVGCLFQVVIFLLVIQSTAVIDMFLNFAALSFVTEVDDVAFQLAKDGYLTLNMAEVCSQLGNYNLIYSKGLLRRRLFLGTLIACILTTYGVLF